MTTSGLRNDHHPILIVEVDDRIRKALREQALREQALREQAPTQSEVPIHGKGLLDALCGVFSAKYMSDVARNRLDLLLVGLPMSDQQVVRTFVDKTAAGHMQDLTAVLPAEKRDELFNLFIGCLGDDMRDEAMWLCTKIAYK